MKVCSKALCFIQKKVKFAYFVVFFALSGTNIVHSLYFAVVTRSTPCITEKKVNT